MFEALEGKNYPVRIGMPIVAIINNWAEDQRILSVFDHEPICMPWQAEEEKQLRLRTWMSKRAIGACRGGCRGGVWRPRRLLLPRVLSVHVLTAIAKDDRPVHAFHIHLHGHTRLIPLQGVIAGIAVTERPDGVPWRTARPADKWSRRGRLSVLPGLSRCARAGDGQNVVLRDDPNAECRCGSSRCAWAGAHRFQASRSLLHPGGICADNSGVPFLITSSKCGRPGNRPAVDPPGPRASRRHRYAFADTDRAWRLSPTCPQKRE